MESMFYPGHYSRPGDYLRSATISILYFFEIIARVNKPHKFFPIALVTLNIFLKR